MRNYFLAFAVLGCTSLVTAEDKSVQPAAVVTPAAAVSAAPSPTSVAPAATPSTQPTARVPHPKPVSGQTLEMTLHDLGNFEYNEDDDKSIPADVRGLDGAKVKIAGFMLPLDQSGRVTRFIIVNDMMSCCYGAAPKLQHVAYVELPKDKWMAATSDRISIEGTLKVNVRRDDGFVLSIFEIQPTSVKLAAD